MPLIIRGQKFWGAVKVRSRASHNILVDVSDIFIYFFRSGRGKGESEVPGGGGGSIFIVIPRRGGGFLQDGEGRGAGKVSAANWGIWGRGGWAKYLFSGPKCPPRHCLC